MFVRRLNILILLSLLFAGACAQKGEDINARPQPACVPAPDRLCPHELDTYPIFRISSAVSKVGWNRRDPYYGTAFQFDIDDTYVYYVTSSHIIPTDASKWKDLFLFVAIGEPTPEMKTVPVEVIGLNRGMEIGVLGVRLTSHSPESIERTRREIKKMFVTENVADKDWRVGILGIPGFSTTTQAMFANLLWDEESRFLSGWETPPVPADGRERFLPSRQTVRLNPSEECHPVFLSKCYHLRMRTWGFSGAPVLIASPLTPHLMKIAGMVWGYSPLAETTYVIPWEVIQSAADRLIDKSRQLTRLQESAKIFVSGSHFISDRLVAAGRAVAPAIQSSVTLPPEIFLDRAGQASKKIADSFGGAAGYLAQMMGLDEAASVLRSKLYPGGSNLVEETFDPKRNFLFRSHNSVFVTNPDPRFYGKRVTSSSTLAEGGGEGSGGGGEGSGGGGVIVTDGGGEGSGGGGEGSGGGGEGSGGGGPDHRPKTWRGKDYFFSLDEMGSVAALASRSGLSEELKHPEKWHRPEQALHSLFAVAPPFRGSDALLSYSPGIIVGKERFHRFGNFSLLNLRSFVNAFNFDSTLQLSKDFIVAPLPAFMGSHQHGNPSAGLHTLLGVVPLKVDAFLDQKKRSKLPDLTKNEAAIVAVHSRWGGMLRGKPVDVLIARNSPTTGGAVLEAFTSLDPVTGEFTIGAYGPRFGRMKFTLASAPQQKGDYFYRYAGKIRYALPASMAYDDKGSEATVEAYGVVILQREPGTPKFELKMLFGYEIPADWEIVYEDGASEEVSSVLDTKRELTLGALYAPLEISATAVALTGTEVIPYVLPPVLPTPETPTTSPLVIDPKLAYNTYGELRGIMNWIEGKFGDDETLSGEQRTRRHMSDIFVRMALLEAMLDLPGKAPSPDMTLEQLQKLSMERISRLEIRSAIYERLPRTLTHAEKIAKCKEVEAELAKEDPQTFDVGHDTADRK